MPTTTPWVPPFYFVFLIDASNKTTHYFQQEINALNSITKYWKLDGSGKLFVTAADTGLIWIDLEHLDGFVAKGSDWDRIRAHLSSNTLFNRANSPMSPTE
ncbi:unnamed protein product [Anisakis simplex]|uniref:Uncharacterized protein n=1 Tax=Anisakis simplex TaxID=6269 RepID=A0A3P6UHG7_ANISI|nr:unnamed protein product [Anisakis simplex]